MGHRCTQIRKCKIELFYLRSSVPHLWLLLSSGHSTRQAERGAEVPGGGCQAMKLFKRFVDRRWFAGVRGEAAVGV
jgi:hypothetical protein